MRKNILIPHLNYMVYVRPLVPDPKEPETEAYVDLESRHHCVMYLKRKCLPPTVAHEITHVLQHLCETRSMRFTEESEHMGYLMQYLMQQILGYEFEDKIPKVK